MRREKIQPELLANSIFRNTPIPIIENALSHFRRLAQSLNQVDLAGKISPEIKDQVKE